MAALAVVPSPAVTAAPLYLIEDQLAALVETAELVSPEQEEEFRLEFQTALTAAVEKRDRVGQFLAHLEQQIDFARSEIDRLRQRKAAFERALARVEEYVIDTIENLGTDSKGKYRRLEGKTTTFSLRGCPPSVEISDESSIPAEYKTLLLKLPAVTWEQLLDRLEIEKRAEVLGQVRSWGKRRLAGHTPSVWLRGVAGSRAAGCSEMGLGSFGTVAARRRSMFWRAR